jgi:hypothetical protein
MEREAIRRIEAKAAKVTRRIHAGVVLRWHFVGGAAVGAIGIFILWVATGPDVNPVAPMVAGALFGTVVGGLVGVIVTSLYRAIATLVGRTGAAHRSRPEREQGSSVE